MFLHDFIVSLYGETTYRVLAVFFNLYPIWLPIILGFVFWNLWVRYVQTAFNTSLPRILLELKPPPVDQVRTPLAMETVLTSMYQGHRESTFFSRYWKGSTRPWFSLEIVSLGGKVHFYIWTEKFLKNVFEAQIYSQYPGAEVHEVEDYVKDIEFNPDQNDIWGMHYEFLNPAPYPIKTYLEYGLDSEVDDETMVDPMASMVEFWSGIKKEEVIWFQIIARFHKKQKRKGFFSPKSDWKSDVEAEIKKIYVNAAKQNEAINKEIDPEGNVQLQGRSRLTKGEQDKIAAMERNVSKVPFDCGVRALYIAPKGIFTKDTTSGIGVAVRQYNNESYNGFKNGDYETDFTNLPWQDFNSVRVNRRKREMLDAYKRRGWFFAPHEHEPLPMSSEELATMFHLPGKAAAAPGLNRVITRKGQAPSNLPI
jgi:hypothetical protein